MYRASCMVLHSCYMSFYKSAGSDSVVHDVFADVIAYA